MGDEMESRICLVTGATDGIGYQTALGLLRNGYFVWAHGRNSQKAALAWERLQAECPGARGGPVSADLESFAQVRTLASSLLAQGQRLDVLVNNAGVYVKTLQRTASGAEKTFGVNFLSPFLLTNLLLPALRQSAQGRIVNVSSVAHRRGTIDFDDLNSERDYDGYSSYAASKLALVLFTYELARRLSSTATTVNALHPGVISTKLLHEGFGLGGEPPEKGALTSIFVATDSSLSTVSGKYFVDSKEVASSPESYDEGLQGRLYEVAEKLTGLGGGSRAA
jgi:NAD(P)-dependent dehydrogenase (short-subunit alcohol dehydrogenase family)